MIILINLCCILWLNKIIKYLGLNMGWVNKNEEEPTFIAIRCTDYHLDTLVGVESMK